MERFIGLNLKQTTIVSFLAFLLAYLKVSYVFFLREMIFSLKIQGKSLAKIKGSSKIEAVQKSFHYKWD